MQRSALARLARGHRRRLRVGVRADRLAPRAAGAAHRADRHRDEWSAHRRDWSDVRALGAADASGGWHEFTGWITFVVSTFLLLQIGKAIASFDRGQSWLASRVAAA